MTRLVVDASVVVKWVFPSANDEPHVEQALALLESIRTGEAQVVQPPHWLAEVAAVIARLDPTVVPEAVGLLYALELPVSSEAEIFHRACDLSAGLNHHLFDTLYHAVALAEPGRVLVTADERYYRKARTQGSILRLEDLK